MTHQFTLTIPIPSPEQLTGWGAASQQGAETALWYVLAAFSCLLAFWVGWRLVDALQDAVVVIARLTLACLLSGVVWTLCWAVAGRMGQ